MPFGIRFISLVKSLMLIYIGFHVPQRQTSSDEFAISEAVGVAATMLFRHQSRCRTATTRDQMPATRSGVPNECKRTFLFISWYSVHLVVTMFAQLHYCTNSSGISICLTYVVFYGLFAVSCYSRADSRDRT